jgi:tRNA(Ile)-lysidine synthase
MTTLQRVKETIVRHGLIHDHDAVLVALSGGPDSVALIHILSRLRRTMHLRIGAVYVNHQMRPRTAKKEEHFCQQLCDSLRIPLTVVREDVPALARKLRRGLEETARQVRYAAFDRLVTEGGYDRVALGHQADDQVETILFRLVRGTGPSGLTGIPIKRGRIIRPLLDLTRADILDYLRKTSLTWCEDASNRSIKFKRNWIRGRLLPQLRRNLNPQVDAAVLALAETLSEEEAYLESVVASIVRKAVSISPGGKFELALTKYSHYASGLRRRLLRYCLKASCPDGYGPDKEVIQRLDSLALAGSGALSLPGELQAVVTGERLFIWRSLLRRASEPFEPGRATELNWPMVRFTGRVTTRRRMVISEVPQSRRVALDWDQLQPPLEVRTIRPGDRFRPLGMKGHKKVSEYLSDRKVPRPLRDEVLLLCDRLGPVWLVGYEIAERAKVDDKTRRVLTIAVSIRKETHGAAV